MEDHVSTIERRASGPMTSGAFELLPAIDIREGRSSGWRRATSSADRLETDPVAVARAVRRQGATWLHVVDLDGAIDGEPRSSPRPPRSSPRPTGRARVELGGGLRTAVAVAGCDRDRRGAGDRRARRRSDDPAFARVQSAATEPERIVGLDRRPATASRSARDGGRARRDPGGRGHRHAGGRRRIVTFEVTSIERTACSRDRPRAAARARGAAAGRIIASGGVASIDDVLAVQAMGCSGVIVGRALYEGRIGLRGGGGRDRGRGAPDGDSADTGHSFPKRAACRPGAHTATIECRARRRRCPADRVQVQVRVAGAGRREVHRR